eukprot:CAMPEP_0167748396 /NCGR_PEP_ID=MMETSP0110_2-20121227/4815_1 /TAXON_ID=629695 /ORGANISM="Gymnochlora sp., Strain CCMP2014" /LENGTH=771 /DNA_ID=CAMNT_0007633407 /DNA_START=44 /DNA_END=2359 /DNA_ORIENTATION=+
MVVGGSLVASIAKDDDTWTSYDVCRLRKATNVQVSPDGKKIAYTLATPDTKTGGSVVFSLHIRDWNGIGSTDFPLVAAESGGARVAKWSPDSKGIYFLSRRHGDKTSCLYYISLTGGEAVRVAKSPTGRAIWNYAVSPCNRYIAYTSIIPDPTPTKLPPGHTHEVYDSNHMSKPATGVFLSPSYDWGVSTENGHGSTLLTEFEPFQLNMPKEAQGLNHVCMPSFSPDGKKLAVFLAPSSHSDDLMMRKKVFVLGLPATSSQFLKKSASGKKRKETKKLSPSLTWTSMGEAGVGSADEKLVSNWDQRRKEWVKNSGPVAWSRDGTKIAFVQGIGPADPKASKLFVVDLNSNNSIREPIRMLTPLGYEGHVEKCVFLTNNLVLTQNSEGCEVVLRAVCTAGPETAGSIVETPETGCQWHKLSVSVSESGTAHLGLLGSSPTHPLEVFQTELSGIREDLNSSCELKLAKVSRVTNSNSWARKKIIGKQEVVRWKSPDGVEIEGVLMWPTKKQDTPAPLIVAVHGGPESHCRNEWLTTYSRPGQIAAANGYFVLYPNYRGSTGRGVAFTQADQGRLAQEQFDDILAGVQDLVSKGLVEPSKVGITGGSYGGYASAWGATYHSEFYQAAVMTVGISDQVSKTLSTDIPDEIESVHWLKHPIWNLSAFIKASPITYIKKSKTPILILHGKGDPRVPPTQSVLLFRGLKRKGDVPTRLVLYGKEGHGNRRFANRLDFSLRQMRWFDHYLRTPVSEEKRRKLSPPPKEVNYKETPRSKL